MIDFNTTYELTGCTDYALVAPRWKDLGINGFTIARGEATLPEELTFVHGAGACRADIIGSGSASLYLISSRLVEGLRGEGITGWTSTPVRFEDGTASDRAYHAFVVTGRCGPIKDEMSSVFEKVRAGKPTKWWKGAFFDPDSWDGTDIFTPVDTGTVFLVSRVRELLRMYDLDGVIAVPLASVERMILPILLSH
jgi:hypothetical protein